MPIESFAADAAYDNLRLPLSRWPTPQRGLSRLSGAVSVDLVPSFHLIPGERIFTIGSCFARNIERRLAHLGFDVATQSVELPIEESGSKDPNGFLNKYNAHSMLAEVRWALDPDAPPADEGFVEADPGLWMDLHLLNTVPPAPLQRVRERRAMFQRLYAELSTCRVVVLTLGLIEAWFDVRTGLYLNAPPPAQARLREPARFRLDVLTVAETLEALNALYDLLLRFGHPDFRIMVTVSPVPMKTSFTGRDVIAANTYSKSALRAAAQEFAARERVDYFPSYEIVSLTPRSAAYAQDQLHVQPELIDEIMDSVVAKCAPSLLGDDKPLSQSEALEQVARAYELLDAGDFAKASKLLRTLIPGDGWKSAGLDEVEFRLQYGRALVRSGKPVAGQVQLQRAVNLGRDVAEAWFHLGMAKAMLRHQIEAEPDIRRSLKLAPDRIAYYVYHARLLIELKRYAEAERSLAAVMAKRPGHKAARTLLAECRKEIERQDEADALRSDAPVQADPADQGGDFAPA